MEFSEEYIRMCEEAYPHLPEEKPEEWEWWVFEKEKGRVLKMVSGYVTDAGIYGPGVGNGYDNSDLDGWTPLYPVWTQDQVQGKIDNMILKDYLDPEDESKSIFLKRLMAFNLWITQWIAQTGEPVAIMFLNMRAEEIWLCFFMFQKYKVMWNNQTQKWQGKPV